MHWINRLLAAALLCSALTLGGVTQAQVPQTINFQGYLVVKFFLKGCLFSDYRSSDNVIFFHLNLTSP